MTDRFAAKLDHEDSAKSARRGGDDTALRARLTGERDVGDDGAQPDLGQREALLRLTAAAAVTGVAAPTSPAFDTVLLGQIAAQIADGVPGAGVSEASVEFPPGSLVQSAQIRRAADGSITVRIAGFDPRLSAMQAGRAQAELRSALAVRRLQVSSLTLERAEDDHDPRLSRPIARVV